MKIGIYSQRILKDNFPTYNIEAIVDDKIVIAVTNEDSTDYYKYNKRKNYFDTINLVHPVTGKKFKIITSTHHRSKTI